MERQKQIEINWERGTQLAILRECQLPCVESPDGKRCSAAALKSILRVIDDHGGGREAWLAFETISREAGISVRHAKRCVACLVEISVVIVERRRATCGVVCNHYRIVWTELDLRRPGRVQRVAPPEAPVPPPSAKTETIRGTSSAYVEACTARVERVMRPPERSATARDQSALGADQSALGSRPKCPGVTQSAPRSAPEAPPPPTPAVANDWAAAAGRFRGRIGQIDSLAAIARERGHSPAEWEQTVEFALRTAAANASKLAKPMGAVVYFLRTGTWPVELTPPEQHAARDAKRTEAMQMQIARGTVREIILAGRRKGASEEEIGAVLRAQFSPAVLAEVGWG